MFRIRPKEKILTPDEFHCCSDGTTPAELEKVDFDLSSLGVSELLGTVVHNPDGTVTKTWTLDPTVGGHFYDELSFYVCCAREGTFTWTQEVSPFNYAFNISLDGISAGGIDITSAGSINFDDPVFSGHADPDACNGLLVVFRADNGPTTVSITI